GVNSRRLWCALGLGSNFKRRERLALLTKNADDVAPSASAESNQYEFHGAGGALVLGGIHYHGMAAGGCGYETLIVRPDSRSFDHSLALQAIWRFKAIGTRYLPCVVRMRLGVDQNAKQLWRFLFEAYLKFSCHVVHAPQWQIVRHRDMA